MVSITTDGSVGDKLIGGRYDTTCVFEVSVNNFALKPAFPVALSTNLSKFSKATPACKSPLSLMSLGHSKDLLVLVYSASVSNSSTTLYETC